MATPIIVNPTKPSQVVVNGTQKSGTPITITTDLDYTRVQSMIDESLGDVKIDTTDLAKQGDNPEATNTKILEETLKVSDKIDNIQLPEIDTTELAKQGDDQEATNTAIFNAVKSLPDLSLLYAARAEKNDDGANTYSIVLPVTAKVTYDNNGVATIQL